MWDIASQIKPTPAISNLISLNRPNVVDLVPVRFHVPSRIGTRTQQWVRVRSTHVSRICYWLYNIINFCKIKLQHLLILLDYPNCIIPALIAGVGVGLTKDPTRLNRHLLLYSLSMFYILKFMSHSLNNFVVLHLVLIG